MVQNQAEDKLMGRTSWFWWFATHNVILAKWWLYSYSSVFKSNYSDQSKFNFDKNEFFINLKETEKIKKIWVRIGKEPDLTGFFKKAAQIVIEPDDRPWDHKSVSRKLEKHPRE